MRASCFRVAWLLKHHERGLSEAERLVLEDHLSGCETCRRDSVALDALGDLVDGSLQTSMARAARERAIAGALEQASLRRSSRPRAVRAAGSLMALGAAAGIVLAVTAFSWTVRRSARLASHAAEAVVPAPTAVTAEPTEHVVAGEVRAGDHVIAVGERVPTDATLSVGKDATLALAHARVSAEASSEVAWRPEESGLALYSGSVRVSVDPAPHQTFRVVAPRFIAQVVGTEFQVDVGGVRVTRGVVRVIARGSPDERVFAELHAGDSWSAPENPMAAATTDRETRPGEAVARTPSEWLASARSQLAGGVADRAERDVTAALAARPNRGETAEAQTLLAECAAVSGHPQRAATIYQQVSDRYADLPAGETALFAAARIELTSGREREGQRLLRSYLARYPKGRFTQEAAMRLETRERSNDP